MKHVYHLNDEEASTLESALRVYKSHCLKEAKKACHFGDIETAEFNLTEAKQAQLLITSLPVKI